MILKIPEHFGTRVYDADGKELQYCTWCDTETGEAIHIKWPIEHTVDDSGQLTVATEWRYHKAPLIYRRLAT
jgi:hypothetical protein